MSEELNFCPPSTCTNEFQEFFLYKTTTIYQNKDNNREHVNATEGPRKANKSLKAKAKTIFNNLL